MTPSQKRNTRPAAKNLTPLREVTLTLCVRCLAGEGGECHTPGCALYMNRAPDLPLTAQAVLVPERYA